MNESAERTTETPEGPETPPEGSEAVRSPEDGSDAGQREDPDAGGRDELSKVRREAAGWRTKLRETESDRDGLRERVAAMQKQEAERRLSDRFENPADVFTVAALEDVLDDDGELDDDKLGEVADRVLAEHKSWRKPAPDFGAGVRGRAAEGKPSFGSALKDAASGR